MLYLVIGIAIDPTVDSLHPCMHDLAPGNYPLVVPSGYEPGHFKQSRVLKEQANTPCARAARGQSRTSTVTIFSISSAEYWFSRKRRDVNASSATHTKTTRPCANRARKPSSSSPGEAAPMQAPRGSMQTARRRPCTRSSASSSSHAPTSRRMRIF
mgnify:CR=1 FL=1